MLVVAAAILFVNGGAVSTATKSSIPDLYHSIVASINEETRFLRALDTFGVTNGNQEERTLNFGSLKNFKKLFPGKAAYKAAQAAKAARKANAASKEQAAFDRVFQKMKTSDEYLFKTVFPKWHNDGRSTNDITEMFKAAGKTGDEANSIAYRFGVYRQDIMSPVKIQ